MNRNSRADVCRCNLTANGASAALTIIPPVLAGKSLPAAAQTGQWKFAVELSPSEKHDRKLDTSSEQVATPMVYYRGGTSKAVIIDRRHLPVENEEQFAAWILAAYGSPDRRQIDGLGGADLLTSKFAVVGPPTRPDADIDYTFYQVASKDLSFSEAASRADQGSLYDAEAAVGLLKRNIDIHVFKELATEASTK